MAIAQVGLGQAPVAGFLGLVIIGAVAVVGLVLAVVFGINVFRAGPARTRDVVFFVVGLVLVSPAVWLTWAVFGDLIPRRKSWDFSAGRSIALLEEEPEADPELRERVGYTYEGNIQSSIKLASNKQWSGKARTVYFKLRSGNVSEIHWQSPQVETGRAYAEAQRLLKELAMSGAANKDLDAWHAQAQRGGHAYFDAEERFAESARIQVQVAPVPGGSPSGPLWTVDVNVTWDEPDV